MKRRFEKYSLSWSETFRLVRIAIGGRPEFYYWLAPVSRADAAGQIDHTLAGSEPVAEDLPDGGVRLVFSARSSLWAQRETIFEFHSDRIESWIRLVGRGMLDRLHWFCGTVEGQAIGSIPGFDRYTTGCPSFLGRRDFAPHEFYTIGVGHQATHFWGPALNSGPLFYAFHRDRTPGCMVAGLVAPAGQNLFDSFDFNISAEGFSDCAG